MNELENLVYRNGRFYDKRTSNRVFVKQATINDSDVKGTNAPPIVEDSTESLTEPLQAIVEAKPKVVRKPPVRRSKV
jgi:hypothetical protein